MNHIYPSVFTTNEAKIHGVSASALYRANNVLSHSRNIKTSGQPEYLEVARKICEISPHAVLSHFTAAEIHMLRLPHWWFRQPADERKIYLLNDGDFRAVRRKEVQAFRTKNLRDDEKVMWKGVLITSVERTVFDLSHELSPYQLVQLIDGAINAHGGYRTIEPLTSIDKLFALCRNHRGERGVKKLKLCLQRARVGSDSAQETLLRLLLEDHGVKDLALNKAVYGEHGELLFQADLAVEKERISIQYEGEHHSGVEQMQKDIHRQRRTESMGWKEVRIVSKDLYQSEFDHDAKDWVPRAVLLVRRALNQARGVTYHSKNTPN